MHITASDTIRSDRHLNQKESPKLPAKTLALNASGNNPGGSRRYVTKVTKKKNTVGIVSHCIKVVNFLLSFDFNCEKQSPVHCKSIATVGAE